MASKNLICMSTCMYIYVRRALKESCGKEGALTAFILEQQLHAHSIWNLSRSCPMLKKSIFVMTDPLTRISFLKRTISFFWRHLGDAVCSSRVQSRMWEKGQAWQGRELSVTADFLTWRRARVCRVGQHLAELFFVDTVVEDRPILAGHAEVWQNWHSK